MTDEERQSMEEAVEAEGRKIANEVHQRIEADRSIKAYFARQMSRVAGLQIVSIVGESERLTIKFSDGYEIAIQLDSEEYREIDGGIVWTAWINVHGGGQAISLRTGKEPT